MTYEVAQQLTREQQRIAHGFMRRGWTYLFLGMISGDLYLTAIGSRVIAIDRNGSWSVVS